MFKHQFEIRVRYSETDKMGFVYYGNYMQYYEVGRVEALRQLGLSYASIENDFGIIMPVVSMNVRYLRPAFYDEIIRIETCIPHLPKTSIKFYTKLFNEKAELLNTSQITLCILEARSKQRIQLPDQILLKLLPYFETN